MHSLADFQRKKIDFFSCDFPFEARVLLGGRLKTRIHEGRTALQKLSGSTSPERLSSQLIVCLPPRARRPYSSLVFHFHLTMFLVISLLFLNSNRGFNLVLLLPKTSVIQFANCPLLHVVCLLLQPTRLNLNLRAGQ